MKSVLLTRSHEGNQEIIFDINKRGINDYFNYIECPLLKYKDLKISSEILANYPNIIITSKHAANIVSNWFDKHKRAYQVWVVGDSCVKILPPDIFTIQAIHKNVAELIENFPQKLYNKTIYLSSNEITQELPLAITKKIIYEVEYEGILSKVEDFRHGIDYILLYSQNTAKTLIKLLIANNLFKFLDNSTVIAISSKVADIIKPFMKKVIYAHENTNQILDILINDAKSKN